MSDYTINEIYNLDNTKDNERIRDCILELLRRIEELEEKLEARK